METTDAKQYIIVNLGHDQYGVEIKYIENIIVMQAITRIPKSQNFFKGVINLRGDIVPVMSLRAKLGLADDEFTSVTRIVIVKPEPSAAPVGIIVDSVREVVNLNDTDIEKLSYDENDKNSNFSLGIGKFGNELINILNIPGLIIEKEAVSQ